MKQQAVDLAAHRAAAAGLGNIRCEAGLIEEFREPFDLAMSIHSCGAASDAAQIQALQQRAGFLMCPCCLGKIAHSVVEYPRSAALRDGLGLEDFRRVAAIADHSE